MINAMDLQISIKISVPPDETLPLSDQRSQVCERTDSLKQWDDTNILAAKRRAFDCPSIDNLDSLINQVLHVKNMRAERCSKVICDLFGMMYPAIGFLGAIHWKDVQEVILKEINDQT